MSNYNNLMNSKELLELIELIDFIIITSNYTNAINVNFVDPGLTDQVKNVISRLIQYIENEEEEKKKLIKNKNDHKVDDTICEIATTSTNVTNASTSSNNSTDLMKYLIDINTLKNRIKILKQNILSVLSSSIQSSIDDLGEKFVADVSTPPSRPRSTTSSTSSICSTNEEERNAKLFKENWSGASFVPQSDSSENNDVQDEDDEEKEVTTKVRMDEMNEEFGKKNDEKIKNERKDRKDERLFCAEELPPSPKKARSSSPSGPIQEPE